MAERGSVPRFQSRSISSRFVRPTMRRQRRPPPMAACSRPPTAARPGVKSLVSEEVPHPVPIPRSVIGPANMAVVMVMAAILFDFEPGDLDQRAVVPRTEVVVDFPVLDVHIGRLAGSPEDEAGRLRGGVADRREPD